MRILLVEDDDRFAGALTTALRRTGHEVDRVASGREALTAPEPELVLLDLGLPDGDGIDVLRRIRTRAAVAVIIVTALGEEGDLVRGLRAGADDYVVKPFGMAELEARIDAVMRRVMAHRREPRSSTRIGPLEVDFERRSVRVNDAEVPLTRKEFDLLATLVRAEGAVVSRERALVEVWRTTWGGTARTLEVHVASLRTKLGDPGLIETVRGVGYRMRVR
ncbi:response regulator transcription factor [Spirillospora sp. NBC_00431]